MSREDRKIKFQKPVTIYISSFQNYQMNQPTILNTSSEEKSDARNHNYMLQKGASEKEMLCTVSRISGALDKRQSSQD